VGYWKDTFPSSEKQLRLGGEGRCSFRNPALTRNVITDHAPRPDHLQSPSLHFSLLAAYHAVHGACTIDHSWIFQGQDWRPPRFRFHSRKWKELPSFTTKVKWHQWSDHEHQPPATYFSSQS
jgi:hypothetical protein